MAREMQEKVQHHGGPQPAAREWEAAGSATGWCSKAQGLPGQEMTTRDVGAKKPLTCY